MIIVSQDKCTIVNLDNIKTIELDRETDFKSIIIFRETSEVETGVCGLLIGHYTTKERAKEVLKEIVEKYSSYLELKGGVAFMQGGMNIQPNIFNIPKVYEMPKE